VLRLLVVFVPRTSSTPVATWFWQTEGRSAECVILGVRLSEFMLSEFQSPSRRIFIGSHSLPPLWSPNRSFTLCLSCFSLSGYFRSHFLWFSLQGFSGLSLRVLMWESHMRTYASFLGDLAPPNLWKGLRFGGFRWSSRRGGYGGWLSIPLDLVSFGAWDFGQR
jgi:hypothetical protein